MPFWRTKTLAELDAGEWESLCDGCGRCCMLKLEDEEDGSIHLTRLSCRLLDLGRGCCRDYENRQREVPDCIVLDVAKVETLGWLPPTCAYRLVAEGRDLPAWHPLVSGDPGTVAAAGISVHGWAVPETPRRVATLSRYIITDWTDEAADDA